MPQRIIRSKSKVLPAPVIRELTVPECRTILERNIVMRVAYSLHDQVFIEPLHYVLVGDWLYGRTSAGDKLSIVPRNHWVAAEIDEIEGIFQWRSVVVHGACYFLPPETRLTRPGTWRAGIEALQRIIPNTFGVADPVPFRSTVFRIELAEVTGRESVPGNP